jgi:hypothetical protein
MFTTHTLFYHYQTAHPAHPVQSSFAYRPLMPNVLARLD